MTALTALVGNFATDPELRFSNAGKAWLKARLSVQPYVPGAETQPDPEFYDVVCFGSLAENVAESCHKGSRVVVAGKIEEKTWIGRDGVERTTTKVIAEGIGPDLRFTTVQVNRTSRRGLTDQPSDDTVSGLVGASPARGYGEEPF